jgi:hypothetical protein
MPNSAILDSMSSAWSDKMAAGKKLNAVRQHAECAET